MAEKQQQQNTGRQESSMGRGDDMSADRSAGQSDTSTDRSTGSDRDSFQRDTRR